MSNKCNHNKRKSRCIECNGSEICQHIKIKYRCIECNGSDICQHNKRKSNCKECEGGSICEHNRIRSRCIECCGGSICEHSRRREQCKDCIGSSICKHIKLKYRCKECNGSAFCKHNKDKAYCKECGGSQICEHNRQKTICKECDGSSICEHSKIRSTCKDCKGGSICEHSKIRSICKDCKGGSICDHNKIKAYCKECGGSGLCKSMWCEVTANKKYEGYCLRCFIYLFPDKPNTRNYKTKENAITDYILTQFPLDKYTWIEDKKVKDGCSKKRPDLFLDLGYHIIIIEVDENQHINYECSCENKRLMELSQDVGHRPIIFIRFNPDEYITKCGKISSCWIINNQGIYNIKINKQKEWAMRLESLKNQIEYWINPNNTTDKTIEVIHLFYNSD